MEQKDKIQRKLTRGLADLLNKKVQFDGESPTRLKKKKKKKSKNKDLESMSPALSREPTQEFAPIKKLSSKFNL